MPDFPETARDQILVTLELARQALAEIERDLKHLGHRAEQLREFLRLGDAMLGTPQELISVPSVLNTSPLPLLPRVRQTAADKAHAILKEVGHPLSVQEIYQRVAANGDVRGKQREALRTALRDNDTVFHRVERGVYGLADWVTTA